MIISASFRTDIPAFYGEWFMNRVSAGYCLVRNPYDGRFHRISLERRHVDGFFFWTKNIGPFLPRLRVLDEQGYPFVVHHTITGYPKELQPTVVGAERAVEHLRSVAADYGGRTAVWRYDPILLTDMTDWDFHRANFARLAQALSGITDEVVVSYAEMYRKTERHLEQAAARHGFHWFNPSAGEKREFLTELSQIARTHEMHFSLCAQRQYLGPGINDACCIDVGRLADVSGIRLAEVKPGHRGRQCGCNQSRDIGAYDTCAHGCVYCYAVNEPPEARRFQRQHDPCSESLAPVADADPVRSLQCEMHF